GRPESVRNEHERFLPAAGSRPRTVRDDDHGRKWPQWHRDDADHTRKAGGGARAWQRDARQSNAHDAGASSDGARSVHGRDGRHSQRHKGPAPALSPGSPAGSPTPGRSGSPAQVQAVTRFPISAVRSWGWPEKPPSMGMLASSLSLRKRSK